ncbi:MAG: FAD-dependent oxidoreductase [Chitinophagaceae bacterium]
MIQFNTIIIGGGLGGLTAGAALSKMGKKVLLLEQHYIPGGCATAFKRKDYLMEVGLHEMDGLFDKDSKVKIFDFLDVNKYVEFLKIPELFHLKSDKSDFTFPHQTEEAQNKLIEKFPHETKGIKLFFKLINSVLVEVPKIPREKWKTILLFPFMPLLFPNTVTASKTSIGHWLDKQIQDDNLKLILLANLVYYGDDPYAMSLLYFSLAQASYIGGGGHFIKGGSQKLSDYLSKYIESHGGQVLLGKKVQTIFVENGKACGVAFHDSFNQSSESITIHANSVIANAAIPLVAEMLPIPYRNSLKKKIKDFDVSCSLISIYMGFNINLKQFGVKHYSTFIQGDDVKSPKDLKGNYQGDWSKKGFVFVDYSQVDSALAPNGKSFGVICTTDYLTEWEGLDDVSYKAKKEKIAGIFLKKLEMCYPGIIKHLDYYEVGTAKTIERYTLNPKGTPYGYAQTPSQSGLRRMPAQSLLKNLYFASAWSFPGGGFTGAITSGFLCAVSMNKKVKWGSHDLATIKDSRVVKLLQKNTIAENTLELIFEKPANFNHEAGQYAILKLNNPRTTHLDMPFRSFSIVSHPSEPTLRFAMRVSDSSFKQSCCTMNASETATIFGPMGLFTLKKNIGDIVFLVCGIGITPVVPMLKELMERQHKGKVFLFYTNRTVKSTAFHDDLQNIALKNYSYITVITSKTKRIDSDLLNTHLVNPRSFDYFLVGTSEFLRSMKQILQTEQVDISRIEEDDFG